MIPKSSIRKKWNLNQRWQRKYYNIDKVANCAESQFAKRDKKQIATKLAHSLLMRRRRKKASLSILLIPFWKLSLCFMLTDSFMNIINTGRKRKRLNALCLGYVLRDNLRYIGLPSVWDILPSAAREVIVAVIDDGVDVTHHEFKEYE